MTERPGDVAIEERVNSGQCELSHFWTDPNSERDMVTQNNQSAMRRWIYYDNVMRSIHQSTRRDRVYAEPVDLPDEIVTSIIKVGKGMLGEEGTENERRKWNYKTDISRSSGLRRVFIEKDQTIKLDMYETLSALNACEGGPRYESIKALLEEELRDINNQTILQVMTNRIQVRESLLPYLSGKVLNKIS